MKNTIKKVSMLLLALMMCMSMAACGGDTNTDQPAGDGALDDTFIYAIGGEPQFLDPAVGSDSVTAYVLNNLYFPLFIIGEDGSMINQACESYEVTKNEAGQDVYTLHLVENNNWSNGDKVTAEHYVYGMKRALGLGAADSYYSYFIGDFVLNAKAHLDNMDDVADMDDVGIVALDEKTIEITLEVPCPYFISLMAAGVFNPVHPDYAKEHDYTWADDPNVPTNGAYYTTKIDRASEVVMKKNPYFTHADKVVTENLICKVMSDPDAQLMAFQTKEIDLATNVNSEVTKIYAGQPELVITDSVINYYVMMNAFGDHEALHDVNVRRALQLGVDRSAIVTALDAGEVYYELYGHVPMGFAGADGDFRSEADAAGAYVYTDKEEAKALLKAAGYDENNPLQLEYYTNQAAMHDIVAEVLKAQWAEIGVEVTLKNGEIRTFFDDRSNGLFETARGAMSADFMDPMTFLDMAATWNQGDFISWGDETYDNLLIESRTLEGAERMAKLHEAEKYLIEEMAYTNPLFGYKAITLQKPGTENAWSSPQGNHVLWYVSSPAD